MKPAIEAKRKALLEFKSMPNVKTSARYSESRSLAQRPARQTLNQYYVGLSEDIETAPTTANLKSMYAGMTTAIGPTVKKTAPIRSKDGVTLTKRADQMNRWIENFFDFYGTERPCTATVINKVSSVEIMEELDDEPEFIEMEAVVARLSNNKTSGRDAILVDLTKVGRQVLLSPLYSVGENAQSHRK